MIISKVLKCLHQAALSSSIFISMYNMILQWSNNMDNNNNIHRIIAYNIYIRSATVSVIKMYN